ncbi:hypothetical protein SELMODRAFT_448337 [Selaginella moellendorffii]|uniref:NAD-dependent epimerase/dehydratase domain-containing protein n=1 Tax=Selaginella moellendorffii TaxID=88036 RepID=D8T6L2_SELML|nr:chloroplast stem-loop binding protein of 41 kDa a, chloroplastic [Selaginella moellendorffii]EFJ07654.1 hypothetical protein SELMODRAFT_448337 [Selaginella moellendorffii]|eukprot:XP_002991226.1 chloroplast stem-loop binding protein of 41 kDa a, chloroplastic [Selaginella moellendorffii]
MALSLQFAVSTPRQASLEISKLTPGYIASSLSLRSPSASSLHSLGTSSGIAGAVKKSSRRWRAAKTVAMAAAANEVSNRKVLIVNTNSGGHAVIGFWLAKDLVAAGHEVTVMTVGEESSDKMKKPPFSRFSELRDLGVSTVWGDPKDVGAAVGGKSFHAVLDNNGKDLDAVKPVVDWAKSQGVEQFLFISSAGIYKTSDEPPHVEGDPVKVDAGHVGVEDYISKSAFKFWSSFRPQYMTGSGNNKDCEEWFFDRIVRDKPVPIPSPGIQVTNIAHVSDLSSMITLAIGKPSASNATIFNAVSDRAVTFDGLVRLCARAAAKEAKIVHYDAKALGIDAKKAFPFRNMHFYAEPRAAKEKLGWTSSTNLSEALKERYEEYIKIGRDKKDIKFEIDDTILSKVG